MEEAGVRHEAVHRLQQCKCPNMAKCHRKPIRYIAVIRLKSDFSVNSAKAVSVVN